MSKIEKILFVVPNDRWAGGRYWHTFPYTAALLGAVLKDNYQISLLDSNINNYSKEQTIEKIQAYKPDVVGISCMSMQYTKNFQEMARLVKSASLDIKVVVGGIYPTLLPNVLIKNENVDFAVLGEGERRLPLLLEYLKKDELPQDMDGVAFKNKNGGVVINPVTTYIHDLENIPLPYYDFLDFDSYANRCEKYSYYVHPARMPYATIITSRGCPFHCIFCSSEAINGPGIRYNTPAHILEEIDMLFNKYGIKEMIVMDDNFYLNHKKLKEILSGLIDRKYDLGWKSINAAVYSLNDEILELMKESGCYQLSLAIESGNKENLKRLKKPTKILDKVSPVVKKAKSLDFQVGAMFVIGSPGETWEQIRESIKLGEDLDLDYCSFNIASPLPKTELYEIAKRERMLPPDFDFDDVDFKGFGRAVITTDEFTPEELQILRAFEWDRINFKTPEKARRISEMTGLTLEEINEWRKSTRRGLGVNVRYK